MGEKKGTDCSFQGKDEVTMLSDLNQSFYNSILYAYLESYIIIKKYYTAKLFYIKAAFQCIQRSTHDLALPDTF